MSGIGTAMNQRRINLRNHVYNPRCLTDATGKVNHLSLYTTVHLSRRHKFGSMLGQRWLYIG